MSTRIKHLLSLATVTFSILLAIASSNGKTIDENKSPVVNVKASQIFTDFAQNELAAKEKYGNKIIAVRGIVASIESYGDGSVVLLNNGDMENVGVKCYFNEDQKKVVAALKKGDPVKIIGEGSESLTIDYEVQNCRMGKLGEN
jgi:uncharacterized protein (DUF1330 family)